jgi:hypothetical protein
MFSKVFIGRWAYGSFFELHVKRGINRSRNFSFTLVKVESCAYFMFCFDFHVLCLEFKMILPKFVLIFLYLGNPFALVICMFVEISIIYLQDHYISKPIIF